ncbi:MAG TPA: hypothetical protein VFV50_05455 [Bdellovibrionales bacterium]|nr:hypothetical protein [Bdellovibrionales bacterium]
MHRHSAMRLLCYALSILVFAIAVALPLDAARAGACGGAVSAPPKDIFTFFENNEYERNAFMYATPWPFAESLALLRALPAKPDPALLDRKSAFTLAAAVVHSWKSAERLFSTELIEWALNNYSILDMSWIHLSERFRNRFKRQTPAQPAERLFLHGPQIESQYGARSGRGEFARRFEGYSVKLPRLTRILGKVWRSAKPLTASALVDFEINVHTLMRGNALFEEGWLMNWRNRRFHEKGLVKIYNIGFDSPFGLVLKHAGEPVGVLSFDIIGEALYLNHIQSVRAKLFEQLPNGTLEYARDRNGRLRRAAANPMAHNLDFSALAIELAREIALEFGFKTLIIQGGRNNKWIRPHGVELPDLTVEKAESIYDRPAQEAGATPDAFGNWVLPLTSP